MTFTNQYLYSKAETFIFGCSYFKIHFHLFSKTELATLIKMQYGMGEGWST